MNIPPAKVALLLFGSGMCALIYQTAWLREFRLIFGATTPSTAAVLAIFMGGLGLGSAVLGRRSEGKARPLVFYGQLEWIIALSAALSPALLWLVRHLYLATGGTQALGMSLGTVLRLLLAVVVLGLPTFLMGGTLPAAARAVATDADASRRRLALLYGANTLGAVTGAALATFFLFEHLGNRMTLWAACGLNGVIALVAIGMGGGSIWEMIRARARGTPCPAAGAPLSDAARIESAGPEPQGAHKSGQFSPRAEGGEGVGRAPAPPAFVLVAAAVVGFAFLLMEIVWFRLLSPLLGGTTFTFGLILAVALLGVGLGGAAYALLSNRWRPTLHAFAFTCALEALCLAVPFALGDRIAVLTALLRPLGSFDFSGHLLAWSAVAALVIFPAALVAGFQFPLLIGLLGAGTKEVGRHTGQAYAWNTAGAIAGSLAGGFGLLPLLTAPGVWRAVVVVLAVLGLAALWWPGQARRAHRSAVVTAGLAALALWLLGSDGPTAAWRHSSIGVGRVDLDEFEDRNKAIRWRQDERGAIHWEAEGREVGLAVNSRHGLAFIVNGKSDGNARGDAGTQVMSGMLGALLHPRPVRVFVIGLGTGTTAGWLAGVPSVERVDAAEMEPAIPTFARMCAPVNHGAMTNAKLNVIIGDGREVLLTARGRYDLIASEPSNPYRAGVASLYTREFYQAAVTKLNDGGLFLQWIQTYDSDLDTLRTAFRTMCSVFPHVETWHTQENDLLFVASRQPPGGDVAALRARLEQEPLRSALEKAWRVTDLEGVVAHYVANEEFSRLVAQAAAGRPLNTDDRMVLEYSFARSVGLPGQQLIAGLQEAARDHGLDRPRWTNGPIDWPSVYRQQATAEVVEGSKPALPRVGARAIARVNALRRYVDEDFEGVLAYWEDFKGEASDLIEFSMLAEAFADAGDERALPHLARLRAYEPVEAAAILALYHWSKGDATQAVDALEAAFLGYRTDPWPQAGVMERAMGLAAEIAGQHPQDFARRLYRALEKPFAVMCRDDDRLDYWLEIARSIDGRSYTDFTLKAVSAREPHVPWNRKFLTIRRDCYARLNLPGAAAAQRDWEKFVRHEPPELDLEAAEPKPATVGPR